MVSEASLASVKFPKTLGKHIPLNIGEREEKKDENQIQKHFRKASVTFP